MREPLLVSSPEALIEARSLLQKASRIALDCESNGMHAWRGRLCVMQLADARDDGPAETVVLVDTLAVPSLEPLAALLGPSGPPKILHDAGFDVRLLRDAGVTLGNVVDTSVYARFLGIRETGLASLLAARCGVTLEKTLQQHDWATRPLGARELAYLTGDVAHLGPLAAQLDAEARAKDIADEVHEETAYAVAHALDDGDEVAPDGAVRPVYARVKGARDLGPASRAVLREVVEVREAAAERWDVPSGRVISNSGLVQIAKARPRSARDVKALGVLQPRGIELAERVAQAVQSGLAQGDIPAQERRWFTTERAPADLGLRKAREALLTHWRTAESARRGVDLQVVLPGHCVTALAAKGAANVEALRAVPGFGEVRVRRYGRALVELLNSVA